MIFRQLIDGDTKTLTYLLGDPWSREAVLVDPVRESVDRDITLLGELGLELTHTLDTHVHADHITGSGLLRARTGCKVVVSKAADVGSADIAVEDGDCIRFGLQALEVRATPGHTNSCVTYVSAKGDLAFTGDAVLIRGCGRTDFQEGDARTLYRSIRDKVFSLPDDTLLYPGHDYKGRTVSSVREEKLYNPRLGSGKTEDEFAVIMEELKLDYPRKIDMALPANRRCGLLDEDGAQPTPVKDARWPVRRTPTGAPNLTAPWVADHARDVRLVDVREEEEWGGPDGHLDGAELVPMSEVADAAEKWDREEPIVLYCRSGGRSDRASIELEGRGFKRVSSMTGGVLKWAALGLPLAGAGEG